MVNKPSGPIVIQAQDVVGNVLTVSTDLFFSVNTSGNGSFSEDSLSWSATNSAVISTGNSQTTLYYQDNISGTYSITFTPANGGIASASQPLVVNPVYDTSLVFTTEPQSVKAGNMSGVITVELQDADGNATTSTSAINVKLLSNSPGAPKFYFDIDGSAEITSLNIPIDKSSVSFYYRDNLTGPALIHAQASDITDGYQLINVTAGDPSKLFITPGPTSQNGQTIIQNYSSDKITVQILDSYGNLVPVAANTTIHLSSSNISTGSFAGDSTNGKWLLTADNPVVVIPKGKSEAYFYYRDSILGQATITASSQPGNNWNAASQIETIYAPVISKLSFITPPRQTDTNIPSSIITVQTQDALGNAIAVSSDTSIKLLTSDTAGGSFALSAGGPWNVTQVAVLTGQSSVSFYYKDTTPGAKNLGISETPSLGWADAIQPIVINAGLPAKLAFISAPQTIGKNSPSGALIVQLQDSQGYPTVYGSDLRVDLLTDSAGGNFTNNNLVGPWGLDSVTLAASSSQAVFYYRDQLPGTYTLTAKIAGKWSTTQLIAVTEGVIHQIGFITVPQSLPTNAASEVITIQTQNDQGDPVNVIADTTISLSSISSSGQFAASASSPWGITQVVIPAGSSKADLYYRDSTAGTFILTAAENPSKGWLDGQQQIIIGSVENTISKLDFTTNPQIDNAAVSGGDISGKITVQTRSSLNNFVNVTKLTYLVVKSSSPTGRFSNALGGPFSNSLILFLQPGQNSADFYYTDTIQGTATLTVSEFPFIGWTPAEQSIEIKAGKITQLAFLTAQQSVLKGAFSGAITIQTRDIYGNYKAVDSDTIIDVSSSSGSGEFYQSEDGSGGLINSIIIPANSSVVSFYYKDGVAGSYQLTADEAIDQNWAAAYKSIVVAEAQLSTLVVQPNYALLPTKTNVQLTAVGYNSAGQPIPDLQVDWQVVNPAAGSVTDAGVLSTADSVGAYREAIKATVNGVDAYATVEVYSKPKETVVAAPPVSSGGGVATLIKIPSQPPVNALLIINDGAPETINRKVNLSLYATGASYMKISEDPAFKDVKAWSDYGVAKSFVLSSGFGKKTLYVKYQSATGDESAVASATIDFLEKLTVAPTTTTPTATVSEPIYVNRIIENYNYIILHQQNGLAPQLPVVISPMANSFILQNNFTITGTAPANTIVTLHIHSPEAVDVKVVTDSTGVFVYKLDEVTLNAGDHQVYASVDQPSGSLVGPAIEFSLLAQAASSSQVASGKGLSISAGLWWWILGVWLLFMIAIFLGGYGIIRYVQRTNQFNFRFLSRRSVWVIISLVAVIMIITIGLGILIWWLIK